MAKSGHSYLPLATLLLLLILPLAPPDARFTDRITFAPVDGSTHFGTGGLAISGATIVVGSLFDADAPASSGSAYVFARHQARWIEEAELIASDAGPNVAGCFGISAATSGDTIVVGADSCAFSPPGAAYVFERQGGAWFEVQKLIASDSSGSDAFGTSVAISDETIAVGANLASAVYVFVHDSLWVEEQKLTVSNPADIGLGFPVDIDGDTLVAGSFESGAAYVFARSGDVWAEEQRLPPTAPGPLPAGGTALSEDTIVLGDPADDLVQVYVRSDGTWELQATLTPVGAPPGEQFGASVAVSKDTIVVGTGTDRAYLFTRNETTWSQLRELRALPAISKTAMSARAIVFSHSFPTNSATVFDTLPTVRWFIAASSRP